MVILPPIFSSTCSSHDMQSSYSQSGHFADCRSDKCLYTVASYVPRRLSFSQLHLICLCCCLGFTNFLFLKNRGYLKYTKPAFTSAVYAIGKSQGVPAYLVSALLYADRQSDLNCSSSSLFVQFSLSFTGCFWHAQLHACCSYTRSSNPKFLLMMLACLHVDANSHMCLHSPAGSCAAQFCQRRYMLGKFAKSPCMLQHAPVAECGAEYPLVIFSHGIGGNRIAYSAIICSLVRQVHQSFWLPPLPSFGFP